MNVKSIISSASIAAILAFGSSALAQTRPCEGSTIVSSDCNGTHCIFECDYSTHTHNNLDEKREELGLGTKQNTNGNFVPTADDRAPEETGGAATR